MQTSLIARFRKEYPGSLWKVILNIVCFIVFVPLCLTGIIPELSHIWVNGWTALAFYALFFVLLATNYHLLIFLLFPLESTRFVRFFGPRGAYLFLVFLMLAQAMFGFTIVLGVSSAYSAYEERLVRTDAEAGNPIAQMQIAARERFGTDNATEGYQNALPWLKKAEAGGYSLPWIFARNPHLFNELWGDEESMLTEVIIFEQTPGPELRSYALMALHRLFLTKGRDDSIYDFMDRFDTWTYRDKQLRASLTQTEKNIMEWYRRERSKREGNTVDLTTSSYDSEISREMRRKLEAEMAKRGLDKPGLMR